MTNQRHLSPPLRFSASLIILSSICLPGGGGLQGHRCMLCMGFVFTPPPVFLCLARKTCSVVALLPQQQALLTSQKYASVGQSPSMHLFVASPVTSQPQAHGPGWILAQARLWVVPKARWTAGNQLPLMLLGCIQGREGGVSEQSQATSSQGVRIHQFYSLEVHILTLNTLSTAWSSCWTWNSKGWHGVSEYHQGEFLPATLFASQLLIINLEDCDCNISPACCDIPVSWRYKRFAP